MHEGPAEHAFRRLFCWVFCRCRPVVLPVVTITLPSERTVFNFTGDRFMATVTVDGGPTIELNVDAFVDDKGNTTTDADAPVWTATGNDSAGNPLVTLVAPSPNGGPQSAQLTISGKVGAVQVNAAFGDQSKLGTPGNYLLSGALNIVPGLAVSGTIEMSGTGVTNP